jgi:hypothetical protein
MNQKLTTLLKSKITIFALATTLLTSNSMALDIPGYVIGKIVNLAENAVFDSVNDMVVRPGASTARAGSVRKDNAQAVEALWASDVFGNYHRTSQANHLQGEFKENGGFNLLDRRFSYHDWTYSITDYDSLLDLPVPGETQRLAGNGLKIVVNNEETFIGSGTIKLWDAYYVVESDYTITGDESLRQTTDKFRIRIRYKLANLNYSADAGLTSVERSYPSYQYAFVSKVQRDKVTNLDLLEDDTEIVAGPIAYGMCKRIWKLELPDLPFLEWVSLATDFQDLADVVLNESVWNIIETTEY